MPKTSSRRGFLGASAAAVSSLANPGLAAAQAAGVTPAGLPDLTSIVTNSGIEGNYSRAARYWHPTGATRAGWSTPGGRRLARACSICPR